MHDQRKTGEGETEQEKDPARTSVTRSMIRNEPVQATRVLDSLELPDRVRLVMRFSGSDRVRLIELSQESESLVKALPAPELWLTIKQAGELSDDAVFLLRSADPSQLQHLADLEWWHKDAIDPLATAYWLMLFSEAGPETVTGWFNRADEELLVSAFSRFFRVYKADPENEGNEPWRELDGLWTLDDVYYLHFMDMNIAPPIQRALLAVRDAEPMKYYSLLDMIEAVPAAELENTARRLRMARLADYGFVDYDEAFEIYKPLSDRELDRMEAEAPPPRELYFPAGPTSEYPLAMGRMPGLLSSALALIEDRAVMEDLSLGLASLVNRILIADSMDMSRLESVEQALAKARTFVNLGLARWSGNEVDKAAHVLRTQHAINLFRAGFTKVLRMARRAHALDRDGPYSRIEHRYELLGDHGLIIKGLMLSRPLYYRGADDKGAPVYGEFRDEDEVTRAERALERARLLELLMLKAFGVREHELKMLKEHYAGDSLAWEVVFLTAAGNLFSGKGFGFSPLAGEDASSALSAMLTKDKPRSVTPEAARRLLEMTRERLSSLAEAGEADLATASEFVDESLALLQKETQNLDLDSLDRRYVKALVIRGRI